MASVLLINNVDVIKNFALSYIEPQFELFLGNQKVSSDIEDKIYALAGKIGIEKKFKIRKMNVATMRAGGYYNALVYCPTIAYVLPIDSPCMLISSGFLEDLSDEEQTFLIGHELIHVRDKHPIYIRFYAILLSLLAAFLWYILQSKIIVHLKNLNFVNKYIFAYYFTLVLSLITIFSISDIILSFYQKKIERIADCESLRILSSYQGGLKLIDRWKNDFKIPEKYPYFGLFATHPSSEERKIYCLNQGKTYEKN